MIVVVCGMYRSGSTFIFNVVRECLLTRGSVAIQAADSIDSDFLQSSPNHLITKTHAPDEFCTRLILAGAVRCICTYRTPEDAIASCMSTFHFSLDQSIEYFHIWLDWHRRTSSYCLNVRYEDVDRHPFRSILRVQEWLLGKAHMREALRIRRKYDKKLLKAKYDALERNATVSETSFSYYDRETFFHRRHISSMRSKAGAETLDDAQLDRIRSALSLFVNERREYHPRDSNAGSY